MANGELTRNDEVTFKECAELEQARIVLARVNALGHFRANTPTGRVEQQEAKNPDMAQLVRIRRGFFVLEANLVCAEVIGVLLGHILHMRRVGLRKGRHRRTVASCEQAWSLHLSHWHRVGLFATMTTVVQIVQMPTAQLQSIGVLVQGVVAVGKIISQPGTQPRPEPPRQE